MFPEERFDEEDRQWKYYCRLTVPSVSSQKRSTLKAPPSPRRPTRDADEWMNLVEFDSPRRGMRALEDSRDQLS